MMERLDAVAVLTGMHHLNLKMLDFEEFRRCSTAARQYREKAEALQTSISVLEELERNRAKARKVLMALRRCRVRPMDCNGCTLEGALSTLGIGGGTNE